ncbi:MAG: BACON domain-containing protein [Pyrinomonadaceae bacterium]
MPVIPRPQLYVVLMLVLVFTSTGLLSRAVSSAANEAAPASASSQSKEAEVNPSGINRWTSNGPHGISESYAFAMAPSNSDVLYAFTRGDVAVDAARSTGNSIFKSADGGDSWARCGEVQFSGILADQMNALAVDPANPNVVYVGAAGGSARTGGVFKSMDGCATWTATSLVDGPGVRGSITGIVVDPNNSLTVYALGLGVESRTGHRFFGVNKSTDGGATWRRITGALPSNGPFNELVIDPRNSSVLYLSTDLLYKSTDGGATWTDINDRTGPGIFSSNVAIDPTNPDTLYATFGRAAFKSLNGGASWSKLANLGDGINDIITDIAVDPGNSQIVYAKIINSLRAPQTGVYKSTDGGANWSLAGLRFGIAGEMFISRQNSNVIYAAETGNNATSGSGVFKSTDGGANWELKTNGLPSIRTLTLAIDPTNPSILYAGTANLGILKSTDRGASWQTTGLAGGFVVSITIDPRASNVIYAGLSGLGIGGVFKSTDSGASWMKLSRANGEPLSGEAIAVNPTNSNHIFVASRASSAFYRSLDGGITLSPCCIPPVEIPTFVIFDPRDPTIVFAGAYKSDDGGTSFFRTNTPGELVFHPTDPRIIYAYGGGTILKSVNGGTTWMDAVNGIPGGAQRIITALAIDSSNPNVLYAGVHNALINGVPANGIYRTIDGGANWSIFSDGFHPPRFSIQNIAFEIIVDPSGAFVHAASQYGVFTYQFGAVCSYSISPTSQSLPGAGGAGSVNVTAGGGCAWTAASNASWITITSGASGAGNGTVNFTVAANNGTARTGTLTVAGQTFTVAQAAAANCEAAIFPVVQPFNAGSGDGRLTVVTANNCGWMATSNADWLSIIAGASDSGTDRVRYTVAANTTGGTRTGTLRVAGQTFTVTQTAATTPSVQFSAATYQFNENDASRAATITLTRTGDTAGAVTVQYATLDDTAAVPCDPTTTQPNGQPFPRGTAYARCDYATSVDTVTFAPDETFKTFTVPLFDDAHVEGNETFQLRLSAPAGATLGARITAVVTLLDNDTIASTTNSINTTPFFVRQHYLDFLAREPEPGEPWSAILNNCSNVNDNPMCDRITVSAAFFGSPEFRLKGFFLFLFYRATLGQAFLPEYEEIITDMRRVTGQTPEEVVAKRLDFADEWVQRPAFVARFAGLSNAAFVDALLANVGATLVTPDPASGVTRNSLVADLDAGRRTRAEALKLLAESQEVNTREFNNAFVAMQYYGYLRRKPEPGGYAGWLDAIGRRGESPRVMVNGFMNSVEYRLRFGPNTP